MKLIRLFFNNSSHRKLGAVRQFSNMGSLKSVDPQPCTILVEGNIASGKSRLVDALSNRPDVMSVAEPVHKWRNVNGQHNVFELMYNDPHRYALTFQTYVQLTMVQSHLRSLEKPQQQFKLMERSLFSARHVFVENLRKANIMPESEYAVLDEWYKWLCANIPFRVDLIVYMRASPEVCYERLQARRRPEEKPVTLDYLRSVDELNEQWLNNSQLHPNRRMPQILQLDANQSVHNIGNEYDRLINWVDNYKCTLRSAHA